MTQPTNVAELARSVGDIVAVPAGDMEIYCRVEDAKSSYGRHRLLVKPVVGNGETWVENWRPCAKKEMNRVFSRVLEIKDVR